MDKTHQNQTNHTTLNCLKVGEKAVVSLVANHSKESTSDMSEISRRLKELGFVCGEELTILHKGYFGGEPIAVRIGQSTFALRNFEAALISVTSVTKSGRI
ncbi:FeoA family protein [Undibacterium sp. SXout20W]|uniref:FeoA family protein n=1 Tax=Undibacterium sp. SXout20W TaxID=3413051 RepID=UPI003BF316F0